MAWYLCQGQLQPDLCIFVKRVTEIIEPNMLKFPSKYLESLQNILQVGLLVFGATAPSGAGPPHSRGV